MSLPPGIRTPPGSQVILSVYVDGSNGQIGVAGPINDTHVLLEILGKAMLALSNHHAQLKAKDGPKIVTAVPVLELPPSEHKNGNPPPLRRL